MDLQVRVTGIYSDSTSLLLTSYLLIHITQQAPPRSTKPPAISLLQQNFGRSVENDSRLRMPIPYPRQESLSSSSSASSESSFDEDEERALIQEEWEESLRQMEVVMSIIIMPFFGKWFGRQWAYWGEFFYTRSTGADGSFWTVSEGRWID